MDISTNTPQLSYVDYCYYVYNHSNYLYNELENERKRKRELENLLEKMELDVSEEISTLRNRNNYLEGEIIHLETELFLQRLKKTKMREDIDRNDESSSIRIDNLIKYKNISKTKKYSYKDVQIASILQKIDSLKSIIDLPEDKYINHHHLMIKFLNIREICKKINNLVGLNDLKREIFLNIIYLIMFKDTKDINFRLHSVIQGPPGVGKSLLAQYLTELYTSLGYLKECKIINAKRSDLVAEYLGQTALKTQDVIDKALGGVLLIDEAYSLGNPEKRDSFSKECLDTLNRNLTEKGDKFICIIVGYKEELESSFFSFNLGLKRRFTFWYNIPSYNDYELASIFLQKIKQIPNVISNITIDEMTTFIKNHPLVNYGGDIDIWIFKSMINASISSLHSNTNQITITLDILDKTYKSMNIKEKSNEYISHLYI